MRAIPLSLPGAISVAVACAWIRRFAAAPAIVQAQGQAGVALVIGNSTYTWEASLPNAKRDAMFTAV